MQEKKIKVVFIGEPQVGKSVIITQLSYKEFLEQYDKTTLVQRNEQSYTFNGRYLKVQYCDTSGDSNFFGLIPPHLQQVDLVIFVCDVTKPKTLENYKKKFQPLLKHIPQGHHYDLVMLANKCDLEERRISNRQCQKFSKQNGFDEWHETSAKNLDSMEDFMLRILEKVSRRKFQGNKSSSLTMKKEEKKEADKKKESKGISLTTTLLVAGALIGLIVLLKKNQLEESRG